MTPSIKKKIAELAQVAQLNGFHACLTGDCPHGSQNECLKAMYVDGAQALHEIYVGEAGEFKEPSIEEASKALSLLHPLADVKNLFRLGARWQHSQLSGQIGAWKEHYTESLRMLAEKEREILTLKRVDVANDEIIIKLEAEIERLKNLLDKYSKEDGTGIVQKQAATIERLRGALERISQFRKDHWPTLAAQIAIEALSGSGEG